MDIMASQVLSSFETDSGVPRIGKLIYYRSEVADQSVSSCFHV